MAEFIYTMKKVRKAHGDKVILDDVTLSFYPGAKIGVVGPNGAGKSSVLRIMAGLDKPNNGEAFLATDATVGILQQEPPLNEEKTVRGNVEEGLGDIKVKLDRFNEVAELMATDYSDELMEEMGRLQEELDHANAWDLDSQLEQAMDALRCPPPDEPVTHLSGGERRRVALCKLSLAKPDLPPGRRECAVARTAPGRLRGRGSGRYPRPILPGQRGAVDLGARPRPRLPVRGQLLDLPGEEGRAAGRARP
jgi:ATPase subunit of ABC transporter with duplicated ATPase domains